jgi:hypothetical protein
MQARLIRWMATLTIGILLAIGLNLSRQARCAENTNYGIITIHNYAGVEPETLILAEAQASRIFKQAGVKIEWRDCPVSAESMALPPADQPAVRPLADVKLVPDSKIPALRRSPDGPGCALGDQVYVFMDGLHKATALAECPLNVVLGHIMAHEVGHVLLGPNSHVPNGIMAPKLGQLQFQLMQMGALFFCPQQAEKIRERIRAQQAAEMAVLLGVIRQNSGRCCQRILLVGHVSKLCLTRWQRTQRDEP